MTENQEVSSPETQSATDIGGQIEALERKLKFTRWGAIGAGGVAIVALTAALALAPAFSSRDNDVVDAAYRAADGVAAIRQYPLQIALQDATLRVSGLAPSAGRGDVGPRPGSGPKPTSVIPSPMH